MPASSDTVQCPGISRITLETDVGHYRDARPVPANEQTLQKCRIGRKIISHQVKTQVLLTTVAGRSSIYLKAEGSKTMLIETVLFIALVVSVGAAIVKAFEMSHDVLHGPYMKRID
jgi:hypothetical protein